MSEKQQTILIVEDEQALSNALKFKFEKEGYQVLIANNGKEGLEKMDSQHVDVVLLDLMMPIMSGYDVLKAIAPHKDVPPIIVLSNLGSEGEAEKVKDLGGSEYIVKSNTPISEIVSIVKKYLVI